MTLSPPAIRTHEDMYNRWIEVFSEIHENSRDFEEVVSIADDIKLGGDFALWSMGDIAVHVDSKYGEDSIGKLADRIGENKGTLDNRKRLCEFWHADTRWNIIRSSENIKYSHFTHAMRWGKHCSDDLKEARDYAEVCINEWADKDIKPTQAAAQVREWMGLPNESNKIGDYIGIYDESHNMVSILEGDSTQLKDETRYRVRIYEIKDYDN